MAGVVRAAVSNWRRRYPDFPQPVGGSATSPVFSWREVETWLKATGKAGQLATAGRTETGTQSLNLVPPLDGTRNDTAAARNGQEMPERAIADLTPGELLARVMVSLLPRSTTSARTGDADATELPVVLDPACAEASLLLAVADRFGDRIRLAGQEILEKATAAAGLNLRTAAHDVAYEIHTGDSLRDSQLSGYLGAAAAVVCEPPFDRTEWPSAELTTDRRWEFGIPATRDAELAWVQHCYAHLRPRGVAVVAVSPRTCVQFSGQHIRAALVRSGVLRDVIALPARMSSVPGTDVYLWVLQRPYGTPDHAAVRMVDLSGLGDPGNVPCEFAAWERLFEDAGPATCCAVSRLELLDGDVNLLPARYVATRAIGGAGDLARVTVRLQALYARVGEGLPQFEAPDSPVRHSLVTLGELERVGALTIKSRDATPLPGDLLLRTLGRPPVVATGTANDDDGVAQVVEIDQSRLDPFFVAGFLRGEATSLPVANTLGALSRDDLRRCRVPRMPLAEQRSYGEAFHWLHELDEALAALARASTHVIDQTVYGLTTGTVVPGGPIMKTADDADANESETRTL